MPARREVDENELAWRVLISIRSPLRYKFRNWYPHRLGSTSLSTLYPLSPLQMRKVFFSRYDFLESSENYHQFSAADLPYVFLRKLFGYLHPIDKLNCSLVCRKWNAILSNKSTWKGSEIRVIVNDKYYTYCCTKNFLNKAGNLIQKLCLCCIDRFSAQTIYKMFPQRMDNLSVLDIGGLKGVSSMFIRTIIKAMPKLEVLNMENVELADIYCLHEIFTETALLRLKELVLTFVPIPDSIMALLVKWNRPLKVLNIDGSKPVHDNQLREVNINNAEFAKTLERFYAHGFSSGNIVFNNLGNFQNLTLLSLTYCPESGDTEYRTIKYLRQLEHLHLTGQCSWLSTDSLLYLFTILPDDPHGFPYRLKYLCVSHFYGLNDAVIKTIIQSCPELKSLNISRSDAVTHGGLRMIAKSLSHLHHLDISFNKGFDTEIMEMIIANLPNLCFLITHACSEINKSDIVRLMRHRSNLFVSIGVQHIMNCCLEEKCEINESIIRRILNVLQEIDGYCCVTDIMKPFL